MPYDFSILIKDFTTVVVLFFLFLVFHSKIKKQSMKESLLEIKEMVGGIFQKDDENGG